MSQNLSDLPTWKVGSDVYLISSMKLFSILHPKSCKSNVQSIYHKYCADLHPCMNAVKTIPEAINDGPLNLYSYKIPKGVSNPIPAFTLKGAEYICEKGVGKADAGKFSEFCGFVTSWKKDQVPPVKKIEELHYKPSNVAMEQGYDMVVDNPNMEPVEEPSEESMDMSVQVAQATPVNMPMVPFDMAMGTGEGNNHTAFFPHMFSVMMNHTIEEHRLAAEERRREAEDRRREAEERERKDRIIEEVLKKLLAKQ